ncbi:2-hydroxyisoflavanone dehydratase [Morella rubra]|uniref:2-hydroxyisoflavanone dehydratase n=1 Tax=Morella rubra TaxID=262757 RepID=A0A6A1W659_9ROSI|nr:2-hydroxyisoflavanone dehydratase [Morella rubra]
MEPNQSEIAFEFLPIIRVYEVTVCFSNILNHRTGVSSKDVTIASESNLTARLYLPKLTKENQKLSLLVYFHGGAFCVSSPFNSKYHSYLNTLGAEANVVAVSVNYRKAPEHPLPAAYDDAWVALQWVVSH